MRIPAALALGALLGVAVVGGYVRACAKPDAVIAAADTALAHAAAAESVVTALRDSAAGLAQTAAGERARADSLSRVAALSKAQARTFHKALDSARTAADSVPILVTVIAEQDSALVQDSLSYATLTAAYESQAAATGQLRAALTASDSVRWELAETLGDARAALMKRRSRWSLGVGPSYGTYLSHGQVRSGPGLSVQLSYRVW